MDARTEAREAAGNAIIGSRMNPRVVIAGAGMSGMVMAISLLEAGFNDITIYEKADRIGGTWRENTYPGLACDVPAHMYTYSFAPNPDWNNRFAEGWQIQQYFERICAEKGLEKYIQFNAEIVNASYRDGSWEIDLKDGARDFADFFVSATGVLHHPLYPDIEGLESFAGEMFHSARWNHDVDLKGKRIGIIGTGSTASQIVPAIIDDVAHLTLFQRTAQWIATAPNKTYTDKDKARVRNVPFLGKILHKFYTRLFEMTTEAVTGNEKMHKRLDDNVRQNLERNVKDPVLKAKLTPDYQAACKRLIMSNDFYPAIQKDNAALVTESIERIVPGGVVTSDGKTHELDILVLATGFKAHNFMRPMTMTGVGGLTLEEAWDVAPRGYRSVAIPGFPNFFMLVGPNTPIGNFSLIATSEIQAAYIVKILKGFCKGEYRSLMPSEAATQKFNDAVKEGMKKTIWVTGCSSWYFDKDGNSALWPWAFKRFKQEMKNPMLDEYELTR